MTPIDPLAIAAVVAEVLERLHIPYVIGGSVALSVLAEPRSTLDLDIILYGGAVIDEPGLCVPHPRAHERAFVLAPLLDAWPDATIPGHGSARECLARMKDQAIERIG